MRPLMAVVWLSLLVGCKREETRVYHVTKEEAPPSQTMPVPASDEAQPAVETPSPASPPAAMSKPQIKYQVPEGWQEKAPSDMRVASFTASGPKGSADISAIPLPIVGRDMELINMWRSNVKLPPTTDPDAVKQAEPVAIGADQGRLFTFLSEQPILGKSKQRMLMAMLTRGEMSWFFKMTGEDEFVTSQKGKFLQFLKSISFPENASAPMVSAPPPSGGNESADSIWTVPAGWQSVPPAQFLLVQFLIPGANGAKAEVNVAEFGGEAGGLLPNVNRWRGQLGLGPLEENDPQIGKSLDVPGGKATLVEFSGVDAKTQEPSRLVGAIVSINGQTWFYKLMGNERIVTQQKNAFIKFIQSANYANAR